MEIGEMLVNKLQFFKMYMLRYWFQLRKEKHVKGVV